MSADLLKNHRNEKTQVEALQVFYSDDNGGEHYLLGPFVMIGHWGVPALVLIFASIYWTLGMVKYYNG